MEIMVETASIIPKLIQRMSLRRRDVQLVNDLNEVSLQRS